MEVREASACVAGWAYSSFRPGLLVRVTISFISTRVGFEPMSGSSGWHFSAKYGPRPVVQIQYPAALMGTPWPAQAP
ncbi:hypothetical protein WJX77_011610 [Trebouxia sp. C0004]